jgi:hypothetical protein
LKAVYASRVSFRWVLAWLILVWSLPASAVTVISNTPIATDGGSTLSNTDWKALIFTSASGSWTIDNVVLGLNPINIGSVPSSPKVEVALYAVSGGVPTTQLATTGVQTININQLRQTYSLTTTGFQLAGSTTYALVVRSDATGIKWGNTATTEPTGSNGFTYTTFQRTGDTGATWSSLPANNRQNVVEITATLTAVGIPLLSGWTLLIMGVALVFLGRSALRYRPSRWSA